MSWKTASSCRQLEGGCVGVSYSQFRLFRHSSSTGLCCPRFGFILALFSFLRVIVLHYDIPSEHEKAYYYAAWAAREYYTDTRRAMELARTLLTRYPPPHYWSEKLIKEWELQDL